ITRIFDEPFELTVLSDPTSFQLGPLHGSFMRFGLQSARLRNWTITVGRGHDGCVAFFMAILVPEEGSKVPLPDLQLLSAFTVYRIQRPVADATRARITGQL